MFGKDKKQEAQVQVQNASHIILTTAPEIPSRRYEIVDVIKTADKYWISKAFDELKADLRSQAAKVGADAVISMVINMNDNFVGGSGGQSIAYGTAVKFID